MNNKSNLNNVKTFGCRLNSLESEIIQRHINVNNSNDLYVINTCSVTNEAEKQARQFIRKISKAKPSSKIIVTGCAAQIDPEKWLLMPEVSKVIGNIEKLDLKSWENVNNFSILTQNIMENNKVNDFKYNIFSRRKRAFIQIQQGCDHRCTFCVIPFGRGNSKSFSETNIIENCKKLANRGFKEIILTGVDITSWGKDLIGEQKLGTLVRKILQNVKNLERLRLSSIDPAEIDQDLYLALEQEERLMPHLHLSIQHGADIILKRMKRRHISDNLYKVFDKLKRNRPDIVLGADFISGFPTETDKDHKMTIKIINDLNICWGHIFPYSPKKGTPASKMPQVDAFVKKIRSREVRTACEKNSKFWLDKQIGNYANVLIEEENKGYSEHYAKVLCADNVMPGTIKKIKVTERKGLRLFGKIMKNRN